MEGGNAMVSHLFFYQLVLLGLLWLCCMLHAAWPSSHAAGVLRPPERILPSPNRPGARHPASCPRGDGRARWTPHGISARIRTVPIGAGSGSAISVPMGIP